MEKQKWYELTHKERYDQIYTKITTQEFWDWWSNKKEQYMEVRIKDFKALKAYAEKYNIPFSASGLYVKNSWQLKKVINHFRATSVMWFGINPRRPIRDKYGRLKFSGKDINIKEIQHMFIDIDRVIKEGPATNEDLMNADILTNNLLKELNKAGFANNYIKICSGNGLQLIIKLDEPIKLPEPEYNEDGKIWVETPEFIEAKNTIQKGIGPILEGYSKIYAEELNVEIDKTCFNMGRVGALHGSFNLKYEKPIPRGIIQIINKAPNKGLTKYLKEIYNKKNIRQEFKNEIQKEQTPIKLSKEQRMLKNELDKNVLIKIMTTHEFPAGGINNRLWYSIKILLHSAGITTQDTQYIKMHQTLRTLHNRGFTDNGLEPQYKNNHKGPIKETDINAVPNIVNKYLRQNKIKNIKTGETYYHKPIFNVAPKGKIREKITIQITPELIKKQSTKKHKLNKLKDDPLTDIRDLTDEIYKIRKGETIPEDYKKGDFKYTDIGEIIVRDQLQELITNFLHSYREKWGDEITIYMMKNYMDDYINYKRFK